MARGARRKSLANRAAPGACVVTFSTRTVARATGGVVSHTTVASHRAGRPVSAGSRAAIEAAIRRLDAERLATDEARRIAEDLALGRAVRDGRLPLRELRAMLTHTRRLRGHAETAMDAHVLDV